MPKIRLYDGASPPVTASSVSVEAARPGSTAGFRQNIQHPWNLDSGMPHPDSAKALGAKDGLANATFAVALDLAGVVDSLVETKERFAQMALVARAYQELQPGEQTIIYAWDFDFPSGTYNNSVIESESGPVLIDTSIQGMRIINVHREPLTLSFSDYKCTERDPFAGRDSTNTLRLQSETFEGHSNLPFRMK